MIYVVDSSLVGREFEARKGVFQQPPVFSTPISGGGFQYIAWFGPKAWRKLAHDSQAESCSATLEAIWPASPIAFRYS